MRESLDRTLMAVRKREACGSKIGCGRWRSWHRGNRKETHVGQYTFHRIDHAIQHTALFAWRLTSSCSGPMSSTGLFVGPHLKKLFADETYSVRNLLRSFYQSASSQEKWATSGSLAVEIRGEDGGRQSSRGRCD